MKNTIPRLFACLALALHLPACTHEVENPDAHVVPESLLLAPNATYDVPVNDVRNPGALRVRARGRVVDASIETVDSFFGQNTRIAITGREVGTADLELLDGDLLLDTLTIEVAPVDHHALAPGQNAFDGLYPAVAEPFGVLVQHGVIVRATARTADGRDFDTPADWNVTLEPTAGIDVSATHAPFFKVEADAPGTHTLTLVAVNGATAPVELVVVDASAIVGIELAMSDRDPETVTFSVVGLTADGRRIIGLDPELTVDGVALEKSIGRWLFERTGPLAADAVVTASWQGFTVTR